jgi:DNA-binding PadR family transcriptional regulator
MSPVRYVLLSLLAREPLTGYDLAQRINTHTGPFWPVRYNQVYPELARLEQEGLVKYETIEQNSYRPAKKVYELLPSGREVLRQWALTPGEPVVGRDEFLLKMYNFWLLEPEQALLQLRDQKHLHEKRALEYEDHLEKLRNQVGPKGSDSRTPLFASIAVLLHGLSYERHYADWCQQMIDNIEQAKHVKE